MKYFNATKIVNHILYRKSSSVFILDSNYNNSCDLYRFNVGEGATEHFYTDAQAGTVIKRSKSSVSVQRDDATRLNVPKTLVGGFSGHTVNNHSIEYDYARNKNAGVKVFTRRKNGRFVLKGQNMWSKSYITNGRNEFYDYNF